MKHHQKRLLHAKEKAVSRGRQPLSRGQRSSWDRLNQHDVLTLSIVEFLEHVVLPRHEGDAKAELLVQAIHDWKAFIGGQQ